MGARLARFTGNSTFADYSEDTWNWLTGVGFIDEETWAVYDGAHVDTNCTDISKFQWSQNAAMLTQGAAFMYNYVSSPQSTREQGTGIPPLTQPQTNGSDIWRDRAEKLSNALLETFFPDGVAYESACEGIESCTTDMIFMKGYVHRWLASATQVAPFLAEKVLPVLQTSAEAAVKQCVESHNGTVSHSCGFYWRNETFVDPAETDGTTGAGENLDVFAAVSSLLIADAAAPATAAGAGNSSDSSVNGQGGSPSGTSDTSSPSGTAGSNSGAGRLGAGVTTSLLISTMAALAWVL